MSTLPQIFDPHSGLNVRIAAAQDEFESAEQLVARRYAWRGYCANTMGADERSLTIIAELGKQLVGTLTIRNDSTAGLLVDGNYGPHINNFRSAGRTVCEVTRLATAPQGDSRTILGLLFQLTYAACRYLHQATDLFIEVNPRHERFYRELLEFVVAAGRSICPRVQAPAVLLHLDLLSLNPERLQLRRTAA